MDRDYKTSLVEPGQQSAAVINEISNEDLATKALEDIHNTERLSGFGRFATKMQNLFQASTSSPERRQSPHLKAAPIMMSLGLLLLLATGLLFLLSKPESTVHSHFRQPTSLSGADDRRSVRSPDTDSPVGENQLVGGEANTDSAASRVKSGSPISEDAAARRFAFADNGAKNNPSISPNPTAVSELQNPATVFVANPTPSPVLNLGSAFREPRSSDLQLPSGTEVIAHTTNAISSGLESPVIAVVDRSVQIGNSVLIPQGARVIGYTAGAIKDRINVRFTSLILPSNREVTISGLALMKDGSAGLVGRVQGSGHPVLSTATRIGTGAAVVATQFAGANSLNQPFSQADYLRNQMAYEIASEGSRYSNRLQQPTSMPIVKVTTNQSIRIFLLSALTISEGQIQDTKSGQLTVTVPTLTAEKDGSPDQSLAAAQTAYIQALESQLTDMRAALDARKSNGHN